MPSVPKLPPRVRRTILEQLSRDRLAKVDLSCIVASEALHAVDQIFLERARIADSESM